MNRILLILTVAVFLTVAHAGHATDSTAQPDEVQTLGGLAFKDEIELTLVNLVAHVDDEAGLPVTDLSMEDFRVIQDGQERALTHFQFVAGEVTSAIPDPEGVPLPTDSQTTDGVAGADSAQRPLYIALYVDNENLDPLDRNRVLSQAATFVGDRLHPPAKMMVFSNSKSLEVVQPFTDDQDLVTRALRDQRRKMGGRVEREQARDRIMDSIRRGEQNSVSARDQRRMLDLIENIAQEETNSLRFSLHALRTAVASMAGLPGKKSLVYISNGLPMVPAMDLYYIYASTFGNPTALTQLHRWDQSREFTALASAANALDVSLYTIGAGGVRQATVGSVEHSGQQDTISLSVGEDNFIDGLRFMADNTGGRAMVYSNDFSRAFTQIGSDLFSYYSLGYTLNSSGGDKVHQIEVELVNHPKLSVRYRQRFVEKSLETRVQEKVITNLLFPIEENPLEVAVTTGTPSSAGPERSTVPIRVEFPLRHLALLPEGPVYVGRALLFIAARDSGGGQSDLVRQEHEVTVSFDQYAELEGGLWTIDAALLMKDGTFTISVGLMDQVTRQASFVAVTKHVASGE